MSNRRILALALALVACASKPPPSPTPPAVRGAAEVFTGDPCIFEKPEREQELDLERTLDAIGIREGSVVADVGAGGGWLTVRLARRVGPTGLVHAIDIQDAMLERVRERAEREGLSNVRLVLASEDGPTLAPQSLDCVVILKTYHEVRQPIPLLRKLRAAMRPNARLAIIDGDNPEQRERARQSARGPELPREEIAHSIARDIVISEAKQAGLWLSLERELPGEDNYLLVFVTHDLDHRAKDHGVKEPSAASWSR